MCKDLGRLLSYIVAAVPIVLFGAALYAAFGEGPTHWAVAQKSEWLGFAGGVIGGLMTLAAAAIAFGLTRRQVDMQAAELKEIRDEKEARGETVRAMLAAAASRVLAEAINNRNSLRSHDGKLHAPATVLSAIPSIKDLMGMDELWRLNKQTVLMTVFLEVKIGGHNKYFTKGTSNQHLINVTEWQKEIEGTIDAAEKLTKSPSRNSL